MKINQKLTSGFISIALLVAVVGYLAVNASQKTLQMSIGESSVALATKMLEYIDCNIYKRLETFQEYSRDLIVQQTVSESNKEFEQLNDIKAYIDNQDRLWTSVPKEETTDFMLRLINNQLSEELREKINFYAGKYGHRIFGEVFITNKYGANVAQTGKTSDYYQADEEWWQLAKENGLYVADVEYDRSADIYSTDICIRLEDKTGNFLGVIKVVLNIEETISIIKKAEATEKRQNNKTLQFKLLTKNGRIIYATEDFEFLQKISGRLSSLLYPQEKVSGSLCYFTVTAGDRLGEDRELFAHVHSKGYRDYEGLGWSLLVEHKIKDIFAPVTRLRNWIILVSLLITALAIVSGIFIAGSIARPIGRLALATAKIGKGDLNTRVDIKSNDETGRLADAFNKMAEDLQKNTTSIQALDDANRQLQKNEQQMRNLNHSLTKRVKELNCIHRVSELITEVKSKSLDDILTEAVDLIPPAWQYPQITCATIIIGNHRFDTGNFGDSQWKMSRDIINSQGKIGCIEVCYLEDKPKIYEGPFLEEERHLIDVLGRLIGSLCERKPVEIT